MNLKSTSWERPAGAACAIDSPTGARRGFTLIELMVVLVLIGIMTAAIVPEMRGTYEDALLRSAARDLVNVLGLSYSRAISVNQVHRVRLDAATGRYVLERRASERESLSGFAPVRDLTGSNGEIDSRISITIRKSEEPADEDSFAEPADEPEVAVPEDAISFYPDGTADAREILLQDRAGFKLVLHVNPITSRVSILGAVRP